MHFLRALRRGLVLLPAVLPLVVALPADAVDRPGFEEQRTEWLQTQESLTTTVADLEDLDAEVARVGEAAAKVKERLESAEGRLQRLRGRLSEASEELRRADRANDEAVMSLGQALRQLSATEDALALHTENLEVQVVAAYKYGGSNARFQGMLDAVMASDSITEFALAYEQLKSSTVDQQDLVDEVGVVAKRLYETRARVSALQRATERTHLAATTQRNEVASLTADQAGLVREMQADRREHRRLLTRLGHQQARYARRVAALESTSDRLYESLRQYRYVGGAPGSKDLLWPTDGAVTSGFGARRHPIFKTVRLHAGIDIPGPTGQSIYAAADGVVLSAGVRGGYGNAVVIDHGDGLTTLYAHQSRFLVAAGDKVTAGDTIGEVGSTGHSTGPHLHFEIRLGGAPTNPLDWY